MKRPRILFGFILIPIIIAVGLGVLYLLMPKLAHCFGTVLSEKGDRLLVAAG